MPEKNGPPEAQANAGGRQQQKADNVTIHRNAGNVKPEKEASIPYFVIDKMSGYIAGGMKPETAAEFTRAELLAIYKGSHYSRNGAGECVRTPPPEALAIDVAMAKRDAAIAEILCAEGQTPAQAPDGRHKRGNGLEGLRAFAKGEWGWT